MNDTMVMGFVDELEKISSVFKDPKADLVGLGLLGIPVAHKLVSKKSDKTEKGMAALEGAGLGTLAAHTLANMPKHASKKLKIAADLWEPETGRVIGSEGGSRASNLGVSVRKPEAAPAKKPQYTMAMHQQAKSQMQPAARPMPRPAMKAAPAAAAAVAHKPVVAPAQAARASGVIGRIGKFFKG